MRAETPIPTVRLIIKNAEGKVLILRRPEGSHGAGGWCLPGGKVDFGNTVAETVRKELFEETNLECTDQKFLFYQDSLPSEESEMHVINFYFECEVAGEIQINNESTEHDWISCGELDDCKLVFLNDHGLQRYWR